MGERMVIALITAVAGGAGAVLRFALDVAIMSRLAKRSSGSPFPWGIWAVNLSGSFAIGLLVGVVGLAHPLSTVLGAGFLGGYTTFSAASYDTVQLLRAGRIAAACMNGFGQLVFAVAFAAFGVWIGSHFAAL